MPKSPPKAAAGPSPLTVHLTPEHRKKLNQLIGYAMMHDVVAHPGRVLRALVLMTEPGPEFLKAVKALDEKEREQYREKRRRR